MNKNPTNSLLEYLLKMLCHTGIFYLYWLQKIEITALKIFL